MQQLNCLFGAMRRCVSYCKTKVLTALHRMIAAFVALAALFVHRVLKMTHFSQRAAMLALQVLYSSYGNSVRLSVHPSVCHTPVLCQNDGT